MKTIEERVVWLANPSEGPHCKHPKICDRTRKCEHFQRKGGGCGKGDVIHIWPPEMDPDA